MKRYNQNEIDKLAEILKNNGVISVPTDTVFGVCAHINSINAYNKLIKTKNRPITKPFPIMCADKEQIKEIAIIDISLEIVNLEELNKVIKAIRKVESVYEVKRKKK